MPAGSYSANELAADSSEPSYSFVEENDTQVASSDFAVDDAWPIHTAQNENGGKVSG